MFDKKSKNETDALYEAITRIHAAMENTTPEAPEYAVMVDQLKKLHEIKAAQQPERISKNAVIAVLGNLAGIGIVLNYERLHVIGTKAFGLVSKIRI
jgi:hypothetical protein